MNSKHGLNGSTWRRWDLHLHAPGTKLSSGYGHPNDENLKSFVNVLEKSDVQAFGITDYFCFDGYNAVVSAYKIHFPLGEKLFIPNIEFRLTETISSDARNVHTHVLIDPKFSTEIKLKQLLSDLQTHKTRDDSRLRCSELSTRQEYEEATVSLQELKSVLNNVFPDETKYLIVTAASNDGLRGVDTKSPRSMSISDELDKASHAFFGKSNNTKYFFNKKRYEDGSTAEKKPVFDGSDAHSFEDLKRLTGDEAGFETTWIKSDLTFRGLRQTLFEPKGRVHIGEKPTVLERQAQDATRFIKELRINQIEGYKETNGSWFNDVSIPFNSELTAIIGNKGSGKSAIADIIGLLGESRQNEHFSFLTDDPQNRKFRQKGFAENFCGKLNWESGTSSTKRLNEDVDTLKPETVKYLPQNYFENLTNEIEVKAFRNEIEEVVFSHVDESDRMGKSTFKELEELKTAQSKSDISGLKVQLRELNIEIVDLEDQANPSTMKSLDEKLKQRQDEYKALTKSLPSKVEKPTGESPEQLTVAKEIETNNKILSDILKRGKHAVEQLASLKTDINALTTLKGSLTTLSNKTKEDKEELREICKRFDLDIDSIVSYNIDTTNIDSKLKEASIEASKLEKESEKQISDSTDFEKILSIPDVRKAAQYLKEAITVLQVTISAPQKRYQRFLQTHAEVTSKLEGVMGDSENPKPGTIKEIEQSILYIKNDLQNLLNKKYTARDDICRSIYQAKERVRSFYESLKSSVENLLEEVSDDEFKVTIDASFVPRREFSNSFFKLVNQTSKGPFKGSSEGQTELNERFNDVDWNSFGSVQSFVKKIVEDISKEDISKQIKDSKEFYDLLFSFEYFQARYELRLDGKNLNQLSPGEKGLLLLVFYLHLDKEKTPLIIDQPEDNLDNDSIFSVLATCIRVAKKSRQVILVTHNPNLAVGADAEQILYVSLDKANGYKFSYDSGSIENPRINDVIVKILEGSKPAFVQRRLKYQIK